MARISFIKIAVFYPPCFVGHPLIVLQYHCQVEHWLDRADYNVDYTGWTVDNAV